MAICDTITKNGQTTEKLSTEAVVSKATARSVKYIPDKVSAINQSMSGRLNPRFVNTGKKTWLSNLTVEYSDMSRSTRAYIKGVVIDAMRYKEGADFFYYGIPEKVAQKMFSDAMDALGVRDPSLKTFHDKTANGYVWISGRTERLSEVMLVAETGAFKSVTIGRVLSEFKRKGVNPECYMILKPRMVCTCPDSIDSDGILVQPWAVGGTPETIYIYGDTKARSPSALVLGDSKVNAKVPKDFTASELVKSLLSDTSGAPFDLIPAP